MPLDLWVLGTDMMSKDLVRFSCSRGQSHPISIDPTFNMDQYEVTLIVYKPFFLRLKGYSQNPLSLGPTMLHHKKNFHTYKVLASTCISNCGGLSEAKGFIRDGKEELFCAWKTEVPKATNLRYIQHFQATINKSSTRLVQERQNPGKEKGIVNSESKKGVKEQLRVAKKVLDKKEIPQKQSTYQPLFSTYLDKQKQ